MRANSMVRACATALATVAFAYVAEQATIASGSPPNEANSSPRFTITSTISSSPTTQIAALLYPGVQRYLFYTVQNPSNVPITVNSLSISSITAPPTCSRANLNATMTTFSGSLIVPPSGSNVVSEPISLIDTVTNQDPCEGTTFLFTYVGSATYASVHDSCHVDHVVLGLDGRNVLGESVDRGPIRHLHGDRDCQHVVERGSRAR